MLPRRCGPVVHDLDDGPGHPGDGPGRRRLAGRSPGVRRQPGHARHLPGSRLRPVRGTQPGRDERVDEVLAVPRRRHLHLGQLPRVPHPGQPERHVGGHPAARRLAPDADHAGPAGVVLDPVPALRRQHRPDDQLQPLQRLPDARRRRAPSRPSARSRRPRRSASPPAARCSTTSRASASPTPRPARPPRCGSWPTGPTSCTGWATPRGVYSSAVLGDQDPRQRPGHPGNPYRAARPGLDRRLEQQREHLLDVRPQ